MSKKHNDVRKLEFPDGEEGQEHFNILWTAFCLAFPGHAKGFEQLKLCNKIGAKLQSISEEMPDQERAVAPNRTLVDRSLLLELTQWEKLKAMVKSDDIPWTHRVGPRVEEVVEWLQASPVVKAELRETTGGQDGDEDAAAT